MVGAQVLIDARTHHLYRTVMRRSPTCRLSHDDPIEIAPVDSTVGQLTVPDMLALDARHRRQLGRGSGSANALMGEPPAMYGMRPCDGRSPATAVSTPVYGM